MTLQQQLQEFKRVFMYGTEVSQEECCQFLLQLPYSMKDCSVVFMPAGSADSRTRILKPLSVLKEMDDVDDFALGQIKQK